MRTNRITNAIDHLRFEHGRRTRFELFGDGAYEEENADRLKTFHDNTLDESHTMERYTVATFDGHGCRIGCVNPYDEHEEPPNSEIHGGESVKDATFFK